MAICGTLAERLVLFNLNKVPNSNKFCWMKKWNTFKFSRRIECGKRFFQTSQMKFTKSKLEKEYADAKDIREKMNIGFKIAMEADKSKQYDVAKKYFIESYDLASIQEEAGLIRISACGAAKASFHLNENESFDIYSKCMVDVIDFDAKESEDTSGIFNMVLGVVEMAYRLGKYDLALEIVGKAKRFAHTDKEVFLVHEFLGLISLEQENYTFARESLLIALKHAEKMDAKDNIVQTYLYLGWVESGAANYPKSVDYLEKCAHLANEWKLTGLEDSARSSLQNLLQVVKDSKEATEPPVVDMMKRYLNAMYSGDYETALVIATETLEMAVKQNMIDVMIRNAECIVQVNWHLERVEDTKLAMKYLISILYDSPDHAMVQDILFSCGKILRSIGDFSGAREIYETVRKRENSPLNDAKVKVELGFIDIHEKNYENAFVTFSSAGETLNSLAKIEPRTELLQNTIGECFAGLLYCSIFSKNWKNAKTYFLDGMKASPIVNPELKHGLVDLYFTEMFQNRPEINSIMDGLVGSPEMTPTAARLWKDKIASSENNDVKTYYTLKLMFFFFSGENKVSYESMMNEGNTAKLVNDFEAKISEYLKKID